MLDIGLGEVIVIAILALLVFGPDRLPKVAADAARALRNVREMATAARRELSDAAGLKEDDELAQAVRDLRDLDPRRALSGEGSGAAGAAGRSPESGGSTGASASGATAPGAAATSESPDVRVQGQSTSPSDPPTDPSVQQAPPVDPDWT